MSNEPRESGRTLIGIEPPMSREEKPTPPSPTSIPRELRYMSAQELAVHVFEELRRRDDEQRQRDDAQTDRENRRDAWVEGMLDDVRELTVECRSVNRDALKATLERDGEILTLHALHGDLRKIIGEPPVGIDQFISRVGEHTRAELEAMEAGTGLAGTVGRLAADVKKHRQSSVVGAAGGTGGVLLVFEVVKNLPPEWMPYGAVLAALGGLGVTLRAAFQKWRRSRLLKNALPERSPK